MIGNGREVIKEWHFKKVHRDHSLSVLSNPWPQQEIWSMRCFPLGDITMLRPLMREIIIIETFCCSFEKIDFSLFSLSHSTSRYWWRLPGFILPQYLAGVLLGEIFSQSFLVTLHFTRPPWLKWVWACAQHSAELIFIMVFKDILYMQILSFYQIFNNEMGAQIYLTR